MPQICYLLSMPTVHCTLCKKPFYAKPRHLKIGWGKFCSQNCQFQSKRNGKDVPCAVCEKPIYRTPRNFKHSKSGLFFCNKACFAIWKNKHLIVGEKHSRWKNGENAYRNIIKRSGTPVICGRCGENDPRILLVHHVDGNRQNNALKNLMWLCHNCHFLIHHYDKERGALVVPIA